MPPVPKIGELQLQLLQVLWSHPGASVAEIHSRIMTDRPLAYTTIATMLRRMEERGWVRHREAGRTFLYEAVVAEKDLNRGVTDHLLDRLFGGSLTEAVHHLLKTRPVSKRELDDLERMIAEARSGRANRKTRSQDPS